MTALEIQSWRDRTLDAAGCVIRNEIEERARLWIHLAPNAQARRAAFDAGINLWIVVHEWSGRHEPA